MDSLIIWGSILIALALVLALSALWLWGQRTTFSQSSAEGDQQPYNLLYNIIHDVANSVENIWYKLENLANQSLEDEGSWRQQQDEIIHDVTHLADLTKDAKLLSNPASGTATGVRELVDMRQVCDEVLRSLHKKARRHGVRLLYDGLTEPPALLAQRSQMKRLLFNLVDNGIKYADGEKTEPKVVLSLHTRANQLVITVSDNGIGIPQAHLAYIWDAPFQPRLATTARIEGTGLGLAIVKRIVSEHSGHLDVASVLGKETIFTIQLPLPGQGRSG